MLNAIPRHDDNFHETPPYRNVVENLFAVAVQKRSKRCH